MPVPTADTLLASLETRTWIAAGTTLFVADEEPAGVYTVYSGELDLFFKGKNGHARPLRSAHNGQILGLSSVVSLKKHDYTAMARTACEVGFIEREQFLHALKESTSLWFNVLRMLSEDLNSSYDSLRQLSAPR